MTGSASHGGGPLVLQAREEDEVGARPVDGDREAEDERTSAASATGK